ncbi:MAG: hypothetical protein KA444_02010 [Bacteroidia bacterium]|nr:hypothetical protein [Bacteroidia bacterium]
MKIAYLFFLAVLNISCSTFEKRVEGLNSDGTSRHVYYFSDKQKTLKYFSFNEGGSIQSYLYSDSILIPTLYRNHGDLFSLSDIKKKSLSEFKKGDFKIDGLVREYNNELQLKSIYFVDQVHHHYGNKGSSIFFYPNSVVKSIHTFTRERNKDVEYIYEFNLNGALENTVILHNKDTISKGFAESFND